MRVRGRVGSGKGREIRSLAQWRLATALTAPAGLWSPHRVDSFLQQALVDGGWRIVALLRLNPAIPYSASNYLFGASGVAFLPYLLASGFFTLPGAFAYVYLGYVGAETLGGRARSGAEWTMLVVGLVATVATVIYVTVLARRAVATIEKRQV